MVDFSVAMSRNCVPYLVPISEACDPTVPWPNSYHWRNPVSDLIRAKWRNSLGMCLLSGHHLVIWERIYLTELGCWCYVFPVFGNDALVEVDVYIHTELFIIFRAMVSTPPKKHTQLTLGLYFGYLWMSNTKEWIKLGIPHRFRDEVWWSGRWTVIWKESNSSFYNPADIFCASSPSFPTFILCLTTFPNSNIALLLSLPFEVSNDLDIFTTFLFYATFLGDTTRPRNKPGTLGWIRVQASKPCKKRWAILHPTGTQIIVLISTQKNPQKEKTWTFHVKVD